MPVLVHNIYKHLFLPSIITITIITTIQHFHPTSLSIGFLYILIVHVLLGTYVLWRNFTLISFSVLLGYERGPGDVLVCRGSVCGLI